MTPPKRALKFLRWFCREDYIEEIEGDLTEIFEKNYERSPGKAKRNFAGSVIRHFRPEFIKPLSIRHHTNPFGMLQNHFKISWRNLYKQKMYSAIKIGGLALGVAACFLISLFIRDELSYDRHYADVERTYRVLGVFNDNGVIMKDVWFPAPFASAIKMDYAEVEESGRYIASELFGAGSAQIRRADQPDNTFEEGLAYMDQSLINMLGLPMVYGSRQHALNEPNTIVITKRKADKYFPKEDPTGKLLVVNNDVAHPYKIGGVIADFRPTSHIQFDFLLTMTGKEFSPGEQTWWGATNYPTYVRLRDGADAKQLAERMTKGVLEKYFLPSLLAEGHMTEKEIREMFKKGHLELQPLQNIYLESDVRDGLSHSDLRFVWLFATIAAFILMIACINFINLSTAKSANRAKEVGLRKVVGSYRSGIVSQFLTESVMISVFSFVLGLALAALLLPYFNLLSAKSIIFPCKEWQLLPIVAGAAITVGVLAGLYPSFYLSSFKPIQVLKGNLSLGGKSASTRSVLVVFQFTTSIILIVSTLVIYRQMDYILNRKLGFDKDQVILIQGAGTLGEKVGTFKEDLLQLSPVKYVSVSDYLPVSGNTKRNQNSFWKEGKEKGDNGVGTQIWRVDQDYIGAMGMRIVEGRNFDIQRQTDKQAVIINQAMAKSLDLKDPIGERVSNAWDTYDVIGVVEDFNFESLKENISPLCLVLGNSPDIVSVKVNTADMQSVIGSITKVWKQLAPHQPVRYTFLDERYAVMYDDVQRMGRVFISFAGFAISVACLGLFALSAFMVEQRGKEISIRLVLGASLNSIFRLLTQNFVKLVFLSIIIATPIAWYIMQKWLEDYVYRTEIGWSVFLQAGGMALLTALLTVSYQSIRAAMTNPVSKLKSE